MKVLLDENFPPKLKPHFKNFEVYSVKDMGWLGYKNGKLLLEAVINGFDMFLSFDKNLKFQLELSKFPIKIIVLDLKSNDIDTVTGFIPRILELLNKAKALPNQAYFELAG